MFARLVRLQSIEGIVANGGVVVTRTYRWKSDLRLTRMWLTVLDIDVAAGPGELARFAFRVSNQEGWYLATDGVAGAYLPIMAMCGDYGGVGQGIVRARIRRDMVPVNIRVRKGDLWTVDMVNTGGVQRRPAMMFEVEDAEPAGAPHAVPPG